jgi:thiamine biosynthesis protein ThiS
MEIILNGQTRDLAELSTTATLADLVSALGLKGDRVALEHNGEIAPRASWASTAVHSGDRFEIVHFVGGGSPGSSHAARRAALLGLLLACTLGLAQAQQSPEPPLLGPTFTVSGIEATQPLKIVAYGDTRFTETDDVINTNPQVRKYLVDQIAREKPDAIFMTGDLPFNGDNPGDWQIYREESKPWQTEHLRVYPTLGNHDVRGGWAAGIRNFDATFPELKGYLYYSVQIGNVYLITLDCTEGYPEGSRQRAWLGSQLEHLPRSVNFVFFLSHMPLYADLQSQVMASLPTPAELSLREYILSLAPKVNAKMVMLNGHIHNYERFESGKITYIVSGGGGAIPYRVEYRGPEDKFQSRSYPNYHYIVLQIHGKVADATMYRVAGLKDANFHLEVKDQFTLTAP